MRKLLLIVLALVIYAVLHEGMHALTSLAYNEYDSFHVRPYGLEVVFKTPVPERQGTHWALISGASNVATILLGWLLLAMRRRIAGMANAVARGLGYWLTLGFLLIDPLNLSLGPFVYGGDAVGIAVGLGVDVLVVQAFFLLILLINREMVVQRLFPAFGVKTRHPLFQPLIKLG